MRCIALALLLLGCKDKESERVEPYPPHFPTNGSAFAPVGEVKGSLQVGGQPQELERCVVGRTLSTYVEAITAAGKLRFEDKTLYWNPVPNASPRGDQLECTKLDRSWGGGHRADGSSYFRGTLSFVCTWTTTPIVGDLVFDCGRITPEERAQLDRNRADLKAQQRDAQRPIDAPGSATPPP